MSRKRGRPEGSGQYGTQLRIRMNEDDLGRLKDICDEDGEQVSKRVRDLIHDYISERKE